MEPKQLPNDAYTVGWISAISTEMTAARAFLDEEHESPEHISEHDNNTYTLGRMGKHNIVIAVLPNGEYGTASAATVARDLLHSFPNVRIGLMVGVGGGAPTEQDIRLGDVVVSSPEGGHGGVFQYDFGKTIQGQTFQETRFLDQPPTLLRTAVSDLKSRYESDGHQIQGAILAALEKKPRMRKTYGQLAATTDRLYRADCVHEQACGTSCSSDLSFMIPRLPREEDADSPTIHYGLIASANQLMKDAVIRDRLAKEKRVLCFEMEAAGLMNHFPCLVIRGICDYSDTHKNKEWQGFAAMTAAAYAKDLLARIAPAKVSSERRLDEVLRGVREEVQGIDTNVKRLVTAQQLDVIKNWLSPSDPSTNLNRARKNHMHGTGQWLLQSSSYKKWKQADNSFLWLHGIPGCGKTILSSSVVADLQCNVSTSQGLVYFYFDFSDVRKQSVDNAVRSLIFQLCHLRGNEVWEKVQALYKACNHGSQQPDSQRLFNLFEDMVQAAGEVWIVLDALDECHESRVPNPASELLSWIQTLRNVTPHIHILVTSRPEREIQSSIEKWATSDEIIPLQSERVAGDINAYVREQVQKMHQWDSRPDIQTEIQAALIQKAKGMFRWVACQVVALESCFDIQTMRETIRTLPGTLDETYARILRNVLPIYKTRTIRLLQFLVFSDRPLAIEEAVDALAVDPSSVPTFATENRMPVPAELLRYCSSLVALTASGFSQTRRSRGFDPFSQMVQLAHYSVKEYLTSDRLDDEVAQHLNPSAARTAIVGVCFAYLLQADLTLSSIPRQEEFPNTIIRRHDALWGGEPTALDFDELFPLAAYSADYWAEHAKAIEETEHIALQSVIDFVSEPGAFHLACMLDLKKIYNLDTFRLLPERGIDYLAFGLYYASTTGLRYTTMSLINQGANIDEAHQGGLGTALQGASYNGHESVVKLLLENGAAKDIFSSGKPTALQHAASYGYKSIVELLLKYGAAPDLKSANCARPLVAALHNDDCSIAQLLLENGASTSIGGQYENALEYASQHGHESGVQLLLQWNASFGEALKNAAWQGHTSIVRLLLDTGADPNVRDHIRRTPLHYAAIEGHHQALKLLVDSGAELDLRDLQAYTALHLAAKEGCLDAVKLLVRLGAEVDTVANSGVTPLGSARDCRKTDVVEFLQNLVGRSLEDSRVPPLRRRTL